MIMWLTLPTMYDKLNLRVKKCSQMFSSVKVTTCLKPCYCTSVSQAENSGVLCCCLLCNHRIMCHAQGHPGIWFLKERSTQSEIIHETNCEQVRRCINAAAVWYLFHKALVLNFHWSFSTGRFRRVGVTYEYGCMLWIIRVQREKCVCVCLHAYLHACVYVCVCQCSYFAVIQPCLIMQVEFIALSLVGYL